MTFITKDHASSAAVIGAAALAIALLNQAPASLAVSIAGAAMVAIYAVYRLTDTEAFAAIVAAATIVHIPKLLPTLDLETTLHATLAGILLIQLFDIIEHPVFVDYRERLLLLSLFATGFAATGPAGFWLLPALLVPLMLKFQKNLLYLRWYVVPALIIIAIFLTVAPWSLTERATGATALDSRTFAGAMALLCVLLGVIQLQKRLLTNRQLIALGLALFLTLSHAAAVAFGSSRPLGLIDLLYGAGIAALLLWPAYRHAAKPWRTAADHAAVILCMLAIGTSVGYSLLIHILR